MSEENKTILERANEAISRGDNEGFLSFCTEDIEWTMVGDRRLKGKDAVRQWMKETYLEPPVFSVSNFIADGDFLVACGDIALKESDGNVAHYTYCDVWRFRDRKMVELRAFVAPVDKDGGR